MRTTFYFFNTRKEFIGPSPVVFTYYTQDYSYSYKKLLDFEPWKWAWNSKKHGLGKMLTVKKTKNYSCSSYRKGDFPASGSDLNGYILSIQIQQLYIRQQDTRAASWPKSSISSNTFLQHSQKDDFCVLTWHSLSSLLNFTRWGLH